MHKSNPQVWNFFLFSNTIQNFLKPLFKMKTNIDQWSKYTLIKRYNKIWTKLKAKNKN
jgi:hypothetical protein